MKLTLAVLVLSLCVSGAWASNPGEPLDCSDWVLLEPGFSCSTWLAYPCDSHGEFCWLSADLAPDNEGSIVATRRIYVGEDVTCGGGQSIYRTEVVRHNGTAETVIGYIEDRCNDSISGAVDRMQPRSFDSTVDFDAANGRLYASMRLNCDGCSDYSSGVWVAAIDGFATTFDILSTFTPTANEIGFTTPYMPEGFQHADYFDTYVGTLSTVGDWSQAQPLDCAYPSIAPSVGDYLTVTDTLPTPAPGAGYYYVTAVNYMGERRYGRRSTGGVLQGRDPAVLPACP